MDPEPSLPLKKEKKIESIRTRWVNDQIATLPFGEVEKYYDGSVALYSSIYDFFVSSNPKVSFLIRSNNEKIVTYIFLSTPWHENKKGL